MNGLTIWPGHRGDGDVAYTVAAALTPAEEGTALKATHDQVIRLTGRLRAGPVAWMTWNGSEGLRICTEGGIDVPTEVADYLATSPTSVLVLAMVPTDRKRPRRKPARRTRKASR